MSYALYHTEKWRRLRRQIYERDNYRCFVCGERGGVLNAHHVLPIGFVGEDSPLALDPLNLVALCVRCHRWVHEDGEFFAAYAPPGTPKRFWRFAYAYFFIKRFWPEHRGGNIKPRATTRVRKTNPKGWGKRKSRRRKK